MRLVQIGIIHTPYKEHSGVPVQPKFGSDTGSVEIFPDYADGLQDLEGFERIWLIFGADRARKYRLSVVPYRDTRERGLFSTRSPSRPNPLCISPVKLLERKGNILKVSDIDILDGSPLYDIKPYVPEFDSFPDSKAGWLDELKADGNDDIRKADARFES